MPSIHDFTPTGHNERENASSVPLPAHSIDEALDEIDRTLHQMLLLAELSASDGALDRDSLQRTLERLRDKINAIADTI